MTIGVRGPRLCAACALLLAACLEPTQATLEITTDAPCAGPSRDAGSLSSVYAGVGYGSVTLESGPSAETHTCDGGDIGTLVIYPEDGAEHANAVVVGVLGQESPDVCFGFADGTVTDAPACIVARRRVAFVAHKPLTVPVTLYAACAGVACDAGSTCQPGAPLDALGRPCVDTEVACDETGRCDVPQPPVGSGGGGVGGNGGNGGSGVGGGGGSGGWNVELVHTGVRHVFGSTDASTIYFSRSSQNGMDQCVTVETWIMGSTTDLGQTCGPEAAHSRTLHVPPLVPPIAAVELGNLAVGFGGAEFEHTVFGNQIADLFLRDESSLYMIVPSAVTKLDLATGDIDPVFQAQGSHLWVQPGANPGADLVVTAGDENVCYGIVGDAFTCLSSANLVGPFLDLWGATGRAVTIGSTEVFNIELDRTPVLLTTETPLGPEGEVVALLRVFVATSGNVTWVAGRAGGSGLPLFVARGEWLAGSGTHSWRSHLFPEYPAVPLSLWGSDDEAWLVLNTGEALRITGPF